MQAGVATGREPRMYEANTTYDPNEDVEKMRKVKARVTKTIFRLCEMVEDGTASDDEMQTLTELLRFVL